MIVAKFTDGKNFLAVSGLYQWDRGQLLKIEGLDLADGTEVHFANRYTDKAIRKKASGGIVIIPDSLLETSCDISAWIYIDSKTTKEMLLSVKARKKPDGFTSVDVGDLERVIDESGLVDESGNVSEKLTELIDLAGIYTMIQQGLYNYGNGVASVQQLFAICVWDKVPLFDYINVTDLTKLCYRNISITRIEFKNTHNVTKFSNTFYGCTSLTDIIGIDLSSSQTVTAMFTSCTALENLVIVGKIRQTLDIKYSPLSVESAKGILLALVDYSGTTYEHKYAIYFSEDVWSALDAEGNTAPHGGTWQEYAYNVLKWNV